MKKTAKKKVTKPSVKQRKNRDNLILFKKGVSGNPKGRPKKEDCLTSIMREYLEQFDPKDEQKVTHAELVVVATVELAKKGNAAALKEVWERMDGKVKDKLEVETKDSGNAILLAKVLSHKELKELHDRLERAINA